MLSDLVYEDGKLLKGGKAIHPRWLGRFDTKEEALNAVNAARQE